MTILKKLNDKQLEAVTNTEGSYLILAGAGSGKTRVLTRKIAYILDSKLAIPEQILAITFTNKAANEMKERIYNLVGYNSNLWVGTFHSICVRILRAYSDRIGINRNFTIYDVSDQRALIKSIIKDLNLDSNMYKANSIQSRISFLKNTDEDIKDLKKMAYSESEKNFLKIFELYESKKTQFDALDFDDLLIKTIELIKSEKDIRLYYQKRFKYIFVDEYQDTNQIQYSLIKLFASSDNNITVVGDADQSIYRWRGADIENILNFERDFKDAQIILLEQNYRSTQNILNCANALIKNNVKRKSKNLWTDNQKGENIRYSSFNYSDDEALNIAQNIKSLIDEGEAEEEIAILYRTNAQSRALEEALIYNSINYKIIGGLKFYDRAEIKDLIAYLNIAANPNDDVSFRRIINVPKRGIGNVTLSRIEELANDTDNSLYKSLAMAEKSGLFNAGMTTKLMRFYKFLENLKYKSETIGILELFDYILDQTEFLKQFQSGTPESESRLDNIEEFRNMLYEFTQKYGEEATLVDLLAEISLMSDNERTEEKENAISLMTVHTAKGTEYNNVFICGMEDGLFPISSAIENPDELEEERRLFYVAITRAKKRLFISSAKRRQIYGDIKASIESRFIDEIIDFIETDDIKTVPIASFTKDKRFVGHGFNTSINRKTPERKQINDLNIGDKVSHKKFGLGIITKKDIVDGDDRVTIFFDEFGLKTLSLNYAILDKVE
ncbi:MAG: 3'-5' exonuclease [Tissierellia bacterium]|nr:3'-5' exonuclease [Tissierellia bacterium]